MLQNQRIAVYFKRKSIRLAILILVILIAVVFGKKFFGANSQSSISTLSSSVQNSDAKAVASIGREFTYPLAKDAKGNATQEFKFFIDRAELRDEIVLKGQKATAAKGRDFLIITLKVTNNNSQSFKISTKDYVRLSTDGETKEWLAPSINNDPVEVQAISTQPTRIGFYVNEGQREFALQVGEISGSKEVISLTLR